MSDIPNLKYSSAFLDNSLNTLRPSYVHLHEEFILKNKKEKFITVWAEDLSFCYIDILKSKVNISLQITPVDFSNKILVLHSCYRKPVLWSYRNCSDNII